jgi:RNA polymerase-associated protein CTR9
MLSDYPGQDIMTGEKPKEEYYRDAAHFLNQGERAGHESGDGIHSPLMLSFLTRGTL